MSSPTIPGYTFGSSSIARSPVTLADLERLQKTLLFGPDDVRALQRSKAILADQTEARFDQVWLDWQHELGLRHHRTKKNKTDDANAVEHISFRYLSALTIPVTSTLKPFLAKKGAAPAEVEAMHAAWVKAVLLQTILWSHPYVKQGDF